VPSLLRAFFIADPQTKGTIFMNRQERRALALAARKAERKADFPSPTMDSTPEVQPVAAPAPKPQISEAQLIANKKNAQHSTGPKTEAGKRASSCNAVKTALTGMTILLPTDDVAAYEKLGQKLIAQHQPANYHEELLVQSLIDTEWRLRRIPSLESGIYEIGRSELADTVPAHLLETQISFKYERPLKNLRLHEARLRRYRGNDLKALKELQAARRENEEKQAPASQQKQAQPKQETNGFVFETPEAPAETERETVETALAEATESKSQAA
jgi:hypothetical protein